MVEIREDAPEEAKKLHTKAERVAMLLAEALKKEKDPSVAFLGAAIFLESLSLAFYQMSQEENPGTEEKQAEDAKRVSDGLINLFEDSPEGIPFVPGVTGAAAALAYRVLHVVGNSEINKNLPDGVLVS